MIGSLRGRVGGRSGNSVIVDVGGVGYVVKASATTLGALGDLGEEVSLLVHTRVREDAISLYGFTTPEEQDLFLLLLGVQGVGTAVALNLLSALDTDGLLAAISGGNRAALATAQGVGTRLATRIVADLQDKVADAGAHAVHRPNAVVRGVDAAQGVQDARTVLVDRLGYSRPEAENWLRLVLAEPGAPTDASSIVNACLRMANARAA